MSDFIESEAEESEEEFDEKELKPKKTQRFMEEDGKILFFFSLGMCFIQVYMYGVCNTVSSLQTKRKKKTQKIRMSKEIYVGLLMMEMRREWRRKNLNQLGVQGAVTQRRK